MKSFVIALFIGVMLVCGSMLYMWNLEEQTEDMLEINSQISQSIERDDYSGAMGKIEELSEKIESFEDFFLATGNHIEIDNIKSSLAELEVFAEYEMKGDSLAKANVLEFMILHLPESVRFRIGNVL